MVVHLAHSKPDIDNEVTRVLCDREAATTTCFRASSRIVWLILVDSDFALCGDQ